MSLSCFHGEFATEAVIIDGQHQEATETVILKDSGSCIFPVGVEKETQGKKPS